VYFGVYLDIRKTPAIIKITGVFGYGDYWARTNDLLRVKQAL
jgi:hypothetical protein